MFDEENFFWRNQSELSRKNIFLVKNAQFSQNDLPFSLETLAQKEELVLVRKILNFEQPHSNTFLAPKNVKAGGRVPETPPPSVGTG